MIIKSNFIFFIDPNILDPQIPLTQPYPCLFVLIHTRSPQCMPNDTANSLWCHSLTRQIIISRDLSHWTAVGNSIWQHPTGCWGGCEASFGALILIIEESWCRKIKLEVEVDISFPVKSKGCAIAFQRNRFDLFLCSKCCLATLSSSMRCPYLTHHGPTC